jgi:aerobic carbon-monoxide dehydrogenase small subunit
MKLTTRAGGKCIVELMVNGESKSVTAYPMDRLLDVLRRDLALTGTKEGCGEGECGSCSVLMDGVLVNSCLIPVLQAHGMNIVTIEGLASEALTRDGKLQSAELHPVQQAFLECGGAQCGICTPGMILATVELLRKKPEPTMDEIREGLSGNLCRCTGYLQIFRAVEEAAQRTQRNNNNNEV